MDFPTIPYPYVFLTLGIGTLTGLIYGLKLHPKHPRRAKLQAALMDLEEQLQHLQSQWRDLHEQQHKITDASLTEQKSTIEIETQQLMTARKEISTQLLNETDAVPPPTKKPGQWRGFVWGVVVSLVIGVLFYNLSDATQPRRDGATMTGNSATPTADALPNNHPPMSGSGATAQNQIQQLLITLRKDPNNVRAMVKLEHILLRQQMLEEAAIVNKRVMALAPDNLEAQVHKALLLSSKNKDKQAFALLDQVLKKDPTFDEAWFFRGMISMQKGDTAAMRHSFKKYVKYAPDSPRKKRISAMLQSSAATP